MQLHTAYIRSAVHIFEYIKLTVLILRYILSLTVYIFKYIGLTVHTAYIRSAVHIFEYIRLTLRTMGQVGTDVDMNLTQCPTTA